MTQMNTTRPADFRDAALAASRQILGHNSDPLRAGASICIRVAEADADRLNWTDRNINIFMIGCLIVIWGGFIVAFFFSRGIAVLAVGCISLLALGAMFGAIALNGKATYGKVFVPGRLDPLFFQRDSALPLLSLELEDMNTIAVTKPTSDDRGILAFDDANHRLLIECLRCRYVIRGEDVYLVSAGDKGTVNVGFKIGEVDLRLVLKPKGAVTFCDPGGTRSKASDGVRLIDRVWATVSPVMAGAMTQPGKA